MSTKHVYALATKQHRFLTPITLFGLALAAAIALALSAPALAGGTKVDCDADAGALGPALAGASSGDKLKIQGTCVGTFSINLDLTLKGDGHATLDGAGFGPVVTVAAGVTVVLEKLTITGGVASDPFFTAGGIFNSGHLTLKRSTVTGNSAAAPFVTAGGIQTGGAPFMPGVGSLTLINSTVSGNSAVSTGVVDFSVASGGIGQNPDSQVTLWKSTVTWNSATSSNPDFVLAAGGVGTSGSLTLMKSTISDNTASGTAENPGGFAGVAGAIGTGEGADITLDKSTLSDNTATADSASVGVAIGGIGLAGGVPLSLTKTEVQENQATAVAPDFALATGAIDMPGSNLVTLTKSDVEENEAESSLFAIGGIQNAAGTLMLEDGEVKENRATSTGAGGVAVGGISTGLGGIAETTLTKSEVEENVASAPAGIATGGLHNFPLGISMLVDDSEVQDNEPINCNFVDPACE